VRLSEVKKVLGARVIVGEEWLNTEVTSACGADLMSDVLCFSKERALLCTGLTNPQVIRTAEMIDLMGIVFVRGKQPCDETIEMARESGLPLLSTTLPLFETCGLLYKAGLCNIDDQSECPTMGGELNAG
jgi:predicted transcriptional regulator